MGDGTISETPTYQMMFHKAVKLDYKEGTVLEVTFQSGEVKRYDVEKLFGKYPQLEALKDRALFLQGSLKSPYGIIWNDMLDIEVETIYQDGEIVGIVKRPSNIIAAYAVAYARSVAGMTQKDLAKATGIDQSDISKIERGISNPSVLTLERIANAVGGELEIKISLPKKE